MDFRIGFGVDFHALRAGRDLRLGGISIPHHQGPVGHSDADVLLHAICDALLGAVNLGDIGTHFPDTDPAFKDINSLVLLGLTMDLVRKKGFQVVNLDSTVCLEAPRIKSYVAAMQKAISACLQMPEESISIKATTTEKMGFVGREEGLVAYATVLLSR